MEYMDRQQAYIYIGIYRQIANNVPTSYIPTYRDEKKSFEKKYFVQISELEIHYIYFLSYDIIYLDMYLYIFHMYR